MPVWLTVVEGHVCLCNLCIVRFMLFGICIHGLL